jgi:serine/threonine-protein kinase
MGGLVVINAATSGFPWAIFPVFGISMSLVNDYVRLRERGVRWKDIFSSGAPRRSVQQPSNEPLATRVAREVSRFRTRVKWFAGSAVAAVTSFAIGSSLNLDPMLVPFFGSIISGVVSLQLSIVSGSRLRGMGISLSQALGSGWENIATPPDERPREIRVAEEIARVAGDSVMRGRYGQLVRDAGDDRLTIRDASSRLSDADKSMVADAGPTADALFERIGAAATALERLENDMPNGAISELEHRIASVEAEPAGAPDRDRRLSLLQRQRASLEELDQRKATLKRQIENASMALRSLRIDMVKLRTLGVGAAIEDVNNATQEARALSIDIGRAIEVADEVRKI